MVDVNLLPDEYRKKEEKEAARKKPPVFEVKLSRPEDEKSEEGKGAGVFQGIFSI